LDELFSVYPTIPEGIRDIDKNLWQRVEQSFRTRNNVELLNILGQNKHNIMSALVLREFLYSL
jgi:hypothetical protein